MTWPRGRRLTAVNQTGRRRCPTGREDCELRIFLVEGRTGEPDVCVQTYRRLSHDLGSPWGPSAAAIRVPARYAERLVELIIEAAAGETNTDEIEAGASPRDGPADGEEAH
jgi:hypothetical protein